MTPSELYDDLAAEHAHVDALVAGLPDETWRRLTPADGWTIAHQITHLAFFDEVAVLALTDAAAFAVERERAYADYRAYEAASLARGLALTPAELLAWWRAGRVALLDALRAADPSARVPWFGPDMSVRSKATARLMETWAHGVDVADALGVPLEATTRLRHVAHIGVAARGYGFLARGLPVPTEPVRVELTGPDGSLWTWGEEGAAAVVRGPALDFCLLVTQRRHRSDVAVEATGSAAEQWLAVAQAFAGPATDGRAPRAQPGETATPS